jgi:hypothetical protein
VVVCELAGGRGVWVGSVSCERSLFRCNSSAVGPNIFGEFGKYVKI